MEKTKSKPGSGRGLSRARAGAPITEADLVAVPGFEPQLIDGESAVDYEAFRQSCLKAVAPEDALERVWVQDFLDYAWEAQRLRRMKTVILQSSRKDSVEKLVHQFGGDAIGRSVSKKISHKWSCEDPEMRQYVDALLKEHGLSQDAIMAQAVLSNIDTLETLDRLISSYDHRRDAAIRELEKRRDHLARRAREYARSMAQDADVEILDAAG